MAELLRKIAAVPPGEKLPVARFARELDATQPVIISLVQRLIADGALDPESLRPPRAAEVGEVGPRHEENEAARQPSDEAVGASAPPEIADGITGQQLRAVILAAAKARGLSPTAVSMAIWNNTSQIFMLERVPGKVQRKTIDKVQAWLNKETQPGDGAADCPQQPTDDHPGSETAAVPAAEMGAGAGSARGGPHAVDRPAPADLPASPTGEELVLAIVDAASARGVPVKDFAAPLAKYPHTWLCNMRKARHPKRETVERVRALIAGEGVPAAAWKQERARQIDGIAADRAGADERQRLTEQAAAGRKPGETLAAAVKREAADAGARRSQARSTGTVANPVERIRQIIAEVEDEDERGELTGDRRSAEQRDLSTMSSVLRRAQRDWPDLCAKIARLAIEMGVSKAEAWRRAMNAGVMALEEGA